MIMQKPKLLEDLGAKVANTLASSPLKDIEKNIKSLVLANLSRLDLVTRDDFEIQVELVRRLRERLAQLEARVAQIEVAAPKGSDGRPV